MRDWNGNGAGMIDNVSNEFPLYLWEIETLLLFGLQKHNYAYFHSTYERLKPVLEKVSEVAGGNFHSTYERLKLFMVLL